MRAYRSAALERFQANGEILRGWQWRAAPSERTCFIAGTLITTRKGDIPIESIVVGDEVLTHTGKYRRVTETIQRPYQGSLITVYASDRTVTATKDHPFCAKTKAGIEWREAQELLPQDNLMILKGRDKVINHNLREFPIQRSGTYSDNIIASALQFLRFASISSGVFVMPVGLINFKGNVVGGQKEVYGVSPSFCGEFLNKIYSKVLKYFASIAFGFSFAGITSVASDTAKSSHRLLRRNNAKAFSASNAWDFNGWAAACFRTVQPIRSWMCIKFIPTSLTEGFSNRSSAFCRTECAGIDPSCLKNLSALSACLFSRPCCLLALPRTIPSRPFIVPNKIGLSALFAYKLLRWKSNSATFTMRSTPLESAIACLRAKSVIPASGMSFRFHEGRATFGAYQFNVFIKPVALPLLAALSSTVKILLPFGGTWVNPKRNAASAARPLDPPLGLDESVFHSSIITRLDTQCKPQTTVYNLEVEEDHTYVANGFLVHNCPLCLAMDGREFGLDEPFAQHPNCRCTAIPLLKDRDAPRRTLGADWFATQDAATQRSILGPGAFDLYREGRLNLGDLVAIRQDPLWGPTLRRKSLKELAGA
jgi:hypothetical protein